MSVYKKIRTEIKNGQSIISALTDLGLSPNSGSNLQVNDITLKTHWRSGENQQVAIAVSREELENSGFHVFDGIGFSWNGQSYDMIYDSTDEHWSSVINRVKQRYAVHEARHLAEAQGYTVQESVQPDGTIQLVCMGGY